MISVCYDIMSMVSWSLHDGGRERDGDRKLGVGERTREREGDREGVRE